MKKYTTDAINLKTYNFNENDKIVVMYSKEKGIIRAVAKGTQKKSSALSGRLETFVANKLLLGQGQNLDTIYQAEAVDTFSGIRKDITKISYAMYVAELVNMFGIEDDLNSIRVYNLFYELLMSLSNVKNPNAVIWNVIKFQLRYMEELGYAVEFDRCVKCGEALNKKTYSFCSSTGGTICCECRPATVHKDNASMKSAFKKAMEMDFSETLYLSNREILDNCFNYLNEYISHRSHKKIKSAEILSCIL